MQNEAPTSQQKIERRIDEGIKKDGLFPGKNKPINSKMIMKKYNTWTKPKPTALYSGEMQDSWEVFLETIKNTDVTEDNVTRGVFVRTSYVDMLDCNITAAYLLSQIVYWHLPGKTKASKVTKLGVVKYGHYWLAKKRDAWFIDGIRLSKDQVDYALGAIEDKGFIILRSHKFNNTPIHHIRLTPKFFDSFFKAETALLNGSGPKKKKQKKQKFLNSNLESFTSGASENYDIPLRKIPKSYNIDNRTKITNNIVTYSASTESVSTSNVVTNTSLPSVNQEEAKPAETFVPVGSSEGEAVTGSVKEAANRVSDYSKYNEYAEQGWQLVDQVKNPQPRPLTNKDPYFFHVFEDVVGKPYPWPQDLQNQWVLEQLGYVEDEWVDTYFQQKFKKKTDYRVHHFLSDGVVNRLQLKNL